MFKDRNTRQNIAKHTHLIPLEAFVGQFSPKQKERICQKHEETIQKLLEEQGKKKREKKKSKQEKKIKISSLPDQVYWKHFALWVVFHQEVSIVISIPSNKMFR